MGNVCMDNWKKRLDSNTFADESSCMLLNNTYIPEEVATLILSFVKEDQLLKCSLVCKKWNDIIKSHSFWIFKTRQKQKPSPKKLPWYVHYCLFTNKIFDKNLLINACGEEEFQNWQILAYGKWLDFNNGYWKTEKPPIGCDLVPELVGSNSCFATWELCSKKQTVSFEGNPVFGRILDEFQPDIYVSEWYAGRFDCGCIYTLRVTLLSAEKTQIDSVVLTRDISQWEGRTWNKVEHVFRNYGKEVRSLVFEHEGKDTHIRAGYYGCKMSGGCVRISSDSLYLSKTQFEVS